MPRKLKQNMKTFEKPRPKSKTRELLPTRKQLRTFVEQVARMYKEGELADLGNGKLEEYSPFGNDDEVDALYALISDARTLTGVQPDCLVDSDEADYFRRCGAFVRKPHVCN